MLSILLPKSNDLSNEVYLDEYIILCKKFAIVDTSWDNFWSLKGDYDYVHLHWPEYYVNWKIPDIEFLKKIEYVLDEWKKKSKIVVTRHNYSPHLAKSKTFDSLYNLFYKKSSFIHHLGNYSKIEFLNNYPALSHLNHYVIPHHIFFSYPNNTTKAQARKYLNIKESNFVFFVFGNIRKSSERKIIQQAFNLIPVSPKTLLVPRWRKASKNKIYVFIHNFFILGWDYIFNIFTNKYILSDDFVSENDVQVYFNSSDLLFIPRIDSLNSGIPFINSIFGLNLIGPEVGNIAESVLSFGGILYNPADLQSLNQAISSYFLSAISTTKSNLVNDEIIALLKSMYEENI